MSQLEQRQMNPNDLNRATDAAIWAPNCRQRFETLEACSSELVAGRKMRGPGRNPDSAVRLTNLQSAALLVIVGEVKVGKEQLC